MKEIFAKELRVINIGLHSFTEVLAKKNVSFVQVDWKPPLGVSETAKRAIDRRTCRSGKGPIPGP